VLLNENPECRSNLQGNRPSGRGLNGLRCDDVVVVGFVVVLKGEEVELEMEMVGIVRSVLVLERVAGVEREVVREEEEEEEAIVAGRVEGARKEGGEKVI
jgi:hypothetical protein